MALAVRAFLQPEELPLKDFFDTWKFKILIGIAVFLVGIMAYAGANDRLTAAPQELLSVAVAPFQKAAAMVSSSVSSLWEKYTNIDNIIAETSSSPTKTPSCAGRWWITTASRPKTRPIRHWPTSRAAARR